jgi:hypothetical protein
MRFGTDKMRISAHVSAVNNVNFDFCLEELESNYIVISINNSESDTLVGYGLSAKFHECGPRDIDGLAKIRKKLVDAVKRYAGAKCDCKTGKFDQKRVEFSFIPKDGGRFNTKSFLRYWKQQKKNIESNGAPFFWIKYGYTETA